MGWGGRLTGCRFEDLCVHLILNYFVSCLNIRVCPKMWQRRVEIWAENLETWLFSWLFVLFFKVTEFSWQLNIVQCISNYFFSGNNSRPTQGNKHSCFLALLHHSFDVLLHMLNNGENTRKEQVEAWELLQTQQYIYIPKCGKCQKRRKMFMIKHKSWWLKSALSTINKLHKSWCGYFQLWMWSHSD